MEVKVHYDNLADRQTKVTEYEAQGLRMLYDNFDPNWKSGNEPYGTMTFTDVILPTSPPPRDFETEIDSLKARIEKLEKR